MSRCDWLLCSQFCDSQGNGTCGIEKLGTELGLVWRLHWKSSCPNLCTVQMRHTLSQLILRACAGGSVCMGGWVGVYNIITSTINMFIIASSPLKKNIFSENMSVLSECRWSWPTSYRKVPVQWNSQRLPPTSHFPGRACGNKGLFCTTREAQSSNPVSAWFMTCIPSIIIYMYRYHI